MVTHPLLRNVLYARFSQKLNRLIFTAILKLSYLFDSLETPMAEKSAEKKTAQTKEPEILDLTPINRKNSKDYSNIVRVVHISLNTNEGQRLAENYVANIMRSVNYLGWAFFVARDDYSKPLCEELTKMITSLETKAIQLNDRLNKEIESRATYFSNETSPAFDNPRTYRAAIECFHGARLISTLVALDNYIGTLKKASIYGLADPYEEVALRQECVALFKGIRDRAREIEQAVRKHNRDNREAFEKAHAANEEEQQPEEAKAEQPETKPAKK